MLRLIILRSALPLDDARTMNTTPSTIPLWPNGIPGSVEAAHAQHPRAVEIPHLALHLLKDGAAKACVVVLPGGGYGTRADHEGTPIAEWLNSIGISAVVCHYRVSPWRHPAPISDARRAIRLVRAHAREWNIDPAKVGILGFSAGGHLACSTAALVEPADPNAVDPIDRLPARPDALVACYAVTSLVSHHAHTGSRDNLLGTGASAEQLHALSPELHVTAQHPPTFILHTAEDKPVPVQLALSFAAALADKKVPFALHVWPKGHHGVGLGRPEHGAVKEWPRVCGEWFQELGWR
jgi:acetyl esterase/lipase